MITSKVSDSFTHLKCQLFDLIENFNNSGFVFADGKRNSIKLFDIDNLKLNVKSFKNHTFLILLSINILENQKRGVPLNMQTGY